MTRSFLSLSRGSQVKVCRELAFAIGNGTFAIWKDLLFAMTGRGLGAMAGFGGFFLSCFGCVLNMLFAGKVLLVPGGLQACSEW